MTILLWTVRTASVCCASAPHLQPGAVRTATPEITDSCAVVTVSIEPDGMPQGRLHWTAEVSRRDGTTAARCDTVCDSQVTDLTLPALHIEEPRLWTPDHPHMYTLRVTARPESPAKRIKEETATQTAEVPLGIRETEYSSGSGMAVNGKPVEMRCVALDSLHLDHADPWRTLATLLDTGANTVSLPRHANLGTWLHACDRLGMMAVPRLYASLADWGTSWQRDTAEWTRLCRNHPSVVMWIVGDADELTPLPLGDAGVTPLRLTAALLRRYDTGRPVCCVSSAVDSLPAVAAEADVLGVAPGGAAAADAWRADCPWLMTIDTEIPAGSTPVPRPGRLGVMVGCPDADGLLRLAALWRRSSAIDPGD